MASYPFGTPPVNQSATGFGFGAQKTTAVVMPNFGASAATPGFGTAAITPSFGAPAGTSAFGATAGAPAFGTQTAAPAFNASANNPAFGVPNAAPSFGAATTAPAFGATAAAPAFGATAAAPAFGATAAAPAFSATAAAPSFGATAAAPAFGATAAAPSFGTTAAAPAFGASGTAAAAPSFSFGTPATAAASGAPTSAAPSLSFGGLGGAAPSVTTTTAMPALGLGGSNFFSKPAATTTSASLNFGTTTTSTSAFPLGGGLFGKPSTSTVPATAPTPFVGLGGVDISSTQPKAGDSKQNVKVKETQVPDEICKTVDALKAYIKTQKTLSSDIGRSSTSMLSNVSNEILNLQWALQDLSNSVEANYNQIKLLRKETTKTIQSVEMAQRTQETPAGLQFENVTPFQYFQNLVAKYEKNLINFREQITSTERHMKSLANPQNVTPEDLKQGFKQINESFISLAGRLHEIHQKVEAQKEQYLNLRKYRLRDATNVFAKLDDPATVVESSLTSFGPTPFSNITAMSNFSKSFANTAASGTSGGATASGGK